MRRFTAWAFSGILACGAAVGWPSAQETAFAQTPAVKQAAAKPAETTKIVDGQKVEVKEDFFENGNLMQHREYYRDAEGTPVYHGRFIYYFPTGKISHDAVYKHGKREGTHLTFHFSGAKESEQNWVDGKQEGKEFWWDEQGSLYRVCEYKDDMPDGVWTWYYPQLSVAMDLGKPKPDGLKPEPSKAEPSKVEPSKDVAGRTKVSEQHWKAGLKEGPWMWWHPNGQLGITGAYKEHRQHGRWKYWGADGKLTEAREYRDGELAQGEITP